MSTSDFFKTLNEYYWGTLQLPKFRQYIFTWKVDSLLHFIKGDLAERRMGAAYGELTYEAVRAYGHQLDRQNSWNRLPQRPWRCSTISSARRRPTSTSIRRIGNIISSYLGIAPVSRESALSAGSRGEPLESKSQLDANCLECRLSHSVGTDQFACTEKRRARSATKMRLAPRFPQNGAEQ